MDESERVQKYEDLVSQDFDSFHHKCGENVVLSTERGLIATRRTGCAEGLVFSAKPFPVGTIFEVKLLEKEDRRSGSLVSTCTEKSTSYSVYVAGSPVIGQS